MPRETLQEEAWIMTDSKEDFEPHVEELFEALEGKVPKETLRKELDTYVNVYGIGLGPAKSGIVKKFGASRRTGVSGAAGVTKKIAELEGTEMNVTVVAKMVFVEKRAITVKGSPKTIISGIAGDDTGTAPFTIWGDTGDYEKGKVYAFRNAYTKKYREQIQLNIGTRGKVEECDDVSLDVKTSADTAPTEMKIGEITDHTGNVSLTGRITEVEPRTVTVQGTEKTIWGGIIADDSGKIQFTAWNDFNLSNDIVVRVENAYVRAWKGIPQLNFGERATVTRTNADVGAVESGPASKTVEEIMRVGGGLDISITGTVVDVRAGSGLIRRCPQCNRSVHGEECTVHGHIVPVNDLRLKATLDDGTGAISVIILKADTENLTGISLAEAEKYSKQKGDLDAVASRMAAAVILKKVTVTGNVMSDEYGPQMTARRTELVNVDVDAEAEKLYGEVEASL